MEGQRFVYIDSEGRLHLNSNRGEVPPRLHAARGGLSASNESRRAIPWNPSMRNPACP